ncbi:MAG: hypothetical protein Q4B59_00320 [Lachnospiraceae bacterium]|nr:hypothetical protein [Lachnospiraceae bacterium]
MKKRLSAILATAASALMLALAAPVIAPTGQTTAEAAVFNTWSVKVDSGYLAIRNAKAYDSRNEIGKLYTGDTVQVTDTSDSQYWFIYSQKTNQFGYVNKDYLVATNQTADLYQVDVNTFLSLRAGAASNTQELARLGDGVVVVINGNKGSDFWSAYVPASRQNGYVYSLYLEDVPGNAAVSNVSGSTMTVTVASGYLALRNAKAYDSRNEIGKLYTGDTVQVQDTSDSTYWWVYSPKHNTSGYVNKNYLTGNAVSVKSGNSWTVKVDSGYLALRNGKAFDSRNEIGKLYTGQTVQVQDTSDSTYWWVYAPSLGKSGYVNRNYLY